MNPARPTKAVVLAAGFGTRMHPLSNAVPKALMPLWGRPMLEHVLRLLQGWGVRSVLINCHARAEQIVAAVLELPRLGLDVHLSFEPTIRGTGGVLAQARWFFDDAPFWMLNADIAADLEPDALLARRPDHAALAALWMHPRRGPRTVSTRSGWVEDFRCARPGSPGTVTFCGLHLVAPRILQYIPEEGESSIITAYQRAMDDGHRIAAVCVPPSYWADIGTPDQYLEAHREIWDRYHHGAAGARLLDPAQVRRVYSLRGRGVIIRGFCAADATAEISPGAILEDTVLWRDARVTKQGACRQAIVGPAALIDFPATRIVVQATDAVTPAGQQVLAAHGWDPIHAMAECLSPRGSDRTFTRVHGATGCLMLVEYQTAREENALYADHARFLRSIGLRVPQVLREDAERRVLLLEDVGPSSLQSLRPSFDADGLIGAYLTVLDQVHRLHRAGAPAALEQGIRLMDPFSASLYRWEHDLFETWFLSSELGLPEFRRLTLRKELRQVSRVLQSISPVLVHRDLQSSNIHAFQGELVFIDFQGMRLGPAAYDLASLLCDPYVSLPLPWQLRLLDAYAANDRQALVDAQWFWWAAIQRLAQALGAYGRLSRLSGAESFRRHIPSAIRMMHRAVVLSGADVPALQALLEEHLTES
jgi:mannose-1-phosphate guanylyltransferase